MAHSEIMITGYATLNLYIQALLASCQTLRNRSLYRTPGALIVLPTGQRTRTFAQEKNMVMGDGSDAVSHAEALEIDM